MKRRQFLKSLLGFALAVPVVKAKEERKPGILDLDTSKQKHGIKINGKMFYGQFRLVSVGQNWDGKFKPIEHLPYGIKHTYENKGVTVGG